MRGASAAPSVRCYAPFLQENVLRHAAAIDLDCLGNELSGAFAARLVDVFSYGAAARVHLPKLAQNLRRALVKMFRNERLQLLDHSLYAFGFGWLAA